MTAVTHLQNLLRLNTTNPPGNEILAADYLAGVLAQAGYTPIVLESAPGRGNVIARYKGDGSLRPLLLYNHLDVVPVEREHWTHDPFGGEIVDGYVWGRGALDMKNVVTQQLMVMLRLAAEAPQLRRDVIFAGCADEETTGRFGLEFLAKEHRSLIDAEFGLSETGALPTYLNEHTLYTIQCGEKGNCRLLLRASADPGHGASPNYQRYAIRQLAIALERLTRTSLPVHLTPTVRRLLAEVSPLLGLDHSADWDPSGVNDFIADVPHARLRSMLTNITRNSAAPTLLRAGTTINVVPSQAEAELDGRILPGQTCADLIAEVGAAIGDDLDVAIIHLSEYDQPALEAPAQGPAWDTLARTLKRHDPRAVIAPYLLAGGTDAKHLAPLGVQTYGFSPMRFPPNFEWRGLVHGHDERIPVDALDWGVDVLYDAILELSR